VGFSSPLFGRYLISVPFLNRGGILAANDAARDALVADARELLVSTRSDFVELRHVRGIDPSLPARETKVSMAIPLVPDRDELWKNVGSKVRNLVRKAEKAGLTVRDGDPARDLDAFYDVFAENMRDLGTPVYSPRFFREVVREFGDSLRMNVVEDGTTVAAAGICVAHGGLTEIHWAASRKEYLKSSPNMLLYWDAISHAASQGLSTFCFGRSTVDSGPYRFKKQWGAEPTPLRWEYLLAPGKDLPGLNPDNPKFKAAVAMWQKLPVGLTKVVGPGIVRHLP
jgi:FemAB-related protein (PEP-CTERM system-associated)